MLGRLKVLTSSLTPAQLASMAGAFVLVVAVVGGSTWWVSRPTYTLLFSDMDAESAGQIVTRLKSLKVPYQLDAGGRGIRVPTSRVDELRLDLSTQGLPASGRIGFEIFDRTSFGATDFLEHVNYRRALEGEIARTIATLSEVSNARVHIAMGKDTLFGEPRPAKASVVLKLRGARALSEATVAGVQNLVASSVEGLGPDAVVILDSFGRPLSQPGGSAGDPAGAVRSEHQQRLEQDLAARVVTLLEPIVGADRVRVNVALKLNPESREETQELWDPNAVVRSRQTTTDQASTSTGGPAVAGARANAPPPAPAPGTPEPAKTPLLLANGPSSSRSAETTNYEISRTTRHTLAPGGEIARLSVAVVLDDDQVARKAADGTLSVARKPRTAEDLQKIHGIVAAAVGLEADRGDQLTVENVAFDEPIVEVVPPPGFVEKYTPQMWEGARLLTGLVIALVGFFMLIRPLLRRIGAASAGVPVALPAGGGAAAIGGASIKTAKDIENEIEAQIDAALAERLGAARLPILTKRMSAIGAKEPENVAKLLRSWMSEPDR